MRLCEWRFLECSHIFQLPGQGIPCSIYNIPGTISIFHISCPIVVDHGMVAVFSLGLHNSRNLGFGSSILHISLTEVVGCIPPSGLHPFIKRNMILLVTLQAVVYHFGECAHHLAVFVIFAHLVQLCIFFIMILIFPFLLPARTSKIMQTELSSIQHLFDYLFRLSGCPCNHFSISHIFLLLLNRCLCVLKSLSCHSGPPFHIILDPFALLFIAKTISISHVFSTESFS